MRCVVEKCLNSQRFKNQPISFHRFPTLPDMKFKWKCALGMKDSEINARMVICSEHFHKSDYFGDTKLLSPSAVPHLEDEEVAMEETQTWEYEAIEEDDGNETNDNEQFEMAERSSSTIMEEAHRYSTLSKLLTKIDAKINKLLHNQISMMESIKGLENNVEDGNRRITQLEEMLYKNDDQILEIRFPIASLHMYDEISENCQRDITFKKALIRKLSAVGGKDLGKTVRNVINRLFALELQKVINFTGKNGKKRLANTEFLQVILETVKIIRSKDFSERAVLKHVKYYLQQRGKNDTKILKRNFTHKVKMDN